MQEDKWKSLLFGVWADPIVTRDKYLDERDDLQAGRTPNRLSKSGNLTIEEIVNLYLSRCEALVKAKKLSSLSFRDYLTVGKLMVKNS